MQTAPTTQAPSVHRKKIGDIVVTSITDGVLHGNFGLVKGIDEADAKKVLASRYRSLEPIFTINCFVVHTGGKCVLIDTGGGNNPMFAAGGLPAALNAAGISPDTVDTILMSHLHPDHSGGLTAEDGRAMFPNAELLLHADEARFWLETTNPPDEMKPYFDSAQAAVKPYKERMRTFTKGEVAPGIESEPLPGHTPGHTGFHIGSGKERAADVDGHRAPAGAAVAPPPTSTSPSMPTPSRQRRTAGGCSTRSQPTACWWRARTSTSRRSRTSRRRAAAATPSSRTCGGPTSASRSSAARRGP